MVEERAEVRVCDAAEQVLRETDNPAVMCTDTGLCGLIAKRAGRVKSNPARTERAVLDALSKQPGNLVAGYGLSFHNRWVRKFSLPEDT